jgi:hypothetical protein
MLYFEFGQDGLAEAHALKAFELAQDGDRRRARGSLPGGAGDRTGVSKSLLRAIGEYTNSGKFR